MHSSDCDWIRSMEAPAAAAAAAPAIVTTTTATFSFRLSATQLIECFLRRKIAGELHHHHHHSVAHRFIRDADVYSAAPYDLVAPTTTGDDGDDHGVCWYFFNDFSNNNNNNNNPSSSRPRRTRRRRSRAVAGGKGGRWHTEAGRKGVRGSAGGYMCKFSYKEGREKENTPSSPPPGAGAGADGGGRWLMVEYGIDGYDIVIAKIYKSPRRPKPNVPPSLALSAAAAFTMSLHEVESLLTTTDASQAMMGAPPRPQLAHGTGQFPATAAAAAATGHYDPAAAAGGHPMVMDDLGNNDGDWVWLWNRSPGQQEEEEVLAGHADRSLPTSSHHHMVMVPSAAVVVGQNETVPGAAAAAAAQAHHQDLTPEPAACVGMLAADVASTSGGGLPSHLELDEFPLDDGLWDYNTYFA